MQSSINKHTNKRFIQTLPVVFGVFTIFCIISPDSVFAAPSGGQGIIKEIRQQYYELAQQYGKQIQKYALNLFKLFASIGIVFFGIKSTFSRAEIIDVIKEFILMMIWMCLCLTAITYFYDWTGYIMDKQLDIASKATGKDIGYISMNLVIIDIGFNIIDNVISNINNIKGLVLGIGYIIIAIIIVIFIALIGARMLVILCESYISMCVSILIMGFGGANFLKDYAINVFRYVISVAFKLFTMEIVLSIGQSFLFSVNNTLYNNTKFQTLFIALVSVLVLFVICQQVPDIVAGIINGSHVGSGAGLAAAAGSLLAASKIMASSVAKTGAAAAHTIGAFQA